jgi:hypothetical protein
MFAKVPIRGVWRRHAPTDRKAEAGAAGLPSVGNRKERRKYYWQVHSGSHRRQTVGHVIFHALASVGTTFIIPTFPIGQRQV